MKKLNTITPRYAMLHGFYQASYSLAIGYASVYLLAQGYSDAIIGILLAVANGAAAILQPALGTLLDKKKTISIQMVSVFLLLIMIVLSGCLLTSMDLLPRAICIILIFTLEFSLQPMVNALCFILEHSGIRLNFGFSRGIGSISYAVASVIIGRLVSVYNESLLPIFYIAFFTGFLIVFLSLWRVPGKTSATDRPAAGEALSADMTKTLCPDTQAPETPLSLWQFCRTYRRFMLFLLGSMMIFFMMFITGNFFTIQIVTAIGGSTSEMGLAVAICAAVELPVMATFNKMNKKVPLYGLLRISILFFILKLTLILLAKSMPVFYAAQFMQAGSYALYYPGAAAYTNRLLPPADLVKGQSMLTAMFTVSGIFGSLIGGFLLNITSASFMLLVSYIIAVIGGVITWFSLQKVH